MGTMPDDSNGPLAVGLYALHDRRFFAALLEDPEKALADVVDSGKLSLTPEDRAVVIRLVAEANKSDWKPLEKWDHYKRTGFWEGGWLMSWEALSPHRPPRP